MIIKTKGLIIKETIVGESDKYVTLFTKEHGTIQAIALKAKSTSNGFASSTQLFVYADFILTSYKDTYRVVNIDIIEMFHPLREDIFALSYASYIAEFITYVTEPGLSQPNLLKLTLYALRALCKENPDYVLIRSTFEIRALYIMGFGLNLTNCVDCDEKIEYKEGVNYFVSIEEGGLLCEKCKKLRTDNIYLSSDALYTIIYIITTPINKVYNFKVKSSIKNQIAKLCARYVPYFVERSFKSLDFLEQLTLI